MDTQLRDLAEAQGGVFATRDANRVGVTDTVLRRLVRRGELVGTRRGSYVLADRYAAAPPDERFRLRVRAVLRARPESVASHHAALALWRVPLWRVDLQVIDVCALRGSRNSTSGVRVHPLPPVDPILIGGAPVVPLPIALGQVVVSSGIASGVCALDGALHQGECTLDQVTAAFEAFPQRWARRLSQALASADPLCESVGETRTRLLLTSLGLPVQTQVTIRRGSTFVARVDFLVGRWVVVEFDGLVKYAGADGAAALAAEKRRESDLTALGYEVVRLTWADLEHPERIAREVRRAGARAAQRNRGSAQAG